MAPFDGVSTRRVRDDREEKEDSFLDWEGRPTLFGDEHEEVEEEEDELDDDRDEVETSDDVEEDEDDDDDVEDDPDDAYGLDDDSDVEELDFG